MFGKIVANTQHTSESTQEILSEVREYINAKKQVDSPPSPTGTLEEWKRQQAEGGGEENSERNWTDLNSRSSSYRLIRRVEGLYVGLPQVGRTRVANTEVFLWPSKSEAKPPAERNEGREKALIHPKLKTKKRRDKKTLNSD